MREQVVVLPPSTDRRKPSFNLGKKDESPLHFGKESRKWASALNKNAEKSRGLVLTCSKDCNRSADIKRAIAEKMKREVVRGAEGDSLEALKQEVEGEREGKGLPCTPPPLQWGQRKRSRCSRADNHTSKPCNSPDDSAVLFRKTVRVQADNALASASPLAPKGNLKAKNGVVRNGPSDVRRERKGSPLAGSKRGCPVSITKQEHQKTAGIMHDCKLSSPNTCAPSSGGGDEVSSFTGELVWPKFALGLSRKEKEEDFLIFKGTKLPQRPRRRPKAVERILHYCSPGTWLVDMSHSRYDVREKKRAKKKPRGLKAMESLDSDSE